MKQKLSLVLATMNKSLNSLKRGVRLKSQAKRRCNLSTGFLAKFLCRLSLSISLQVRHASKFKKDQRRKTQNQVLATTKQKM